MFTLVSFYQSIDPAAVYTAINAVLDQHVRVNGTDLFVPELNKIVAAAAGVETTVESFMRLTSPSMRAMARFQIAPFNGAAAGAVEPASPHVITDLRTSPFELVAQETLNAELNSNPAAAQIQWALIWLADAPIAPVNGKMFTTRATGATALVAGTWTPVPVTFDEDLPRGRYQLVGMRCRSTGCIAGRMNFIGGRWRPGCMGVDAQTDLEHPMFRNGGLGVWGEFEDVDTPSVEVLSVSADAAQSFEFDLIQVRSGPA